MYYITDQNPIGGKLACQVDKNELAKVFVSPYLPKMIEQINMFFLLCESDRPILSLVHVDLSSTASFRFNEKVFG